MYEYIRMLLSERGKTFADLSRATGILQSTFSVGKKRDSNMSLKNAIKVADYLGITLDELVRGAK